MAWRGMKHVQLCQKSECQWRSPLLLHLQRVLKCDPSPHGKDEPRDIHYPPSHGDLHSTLFSPNPP